MGQRGNFFTTPYNKERPVVDNEKMTPARRIVEGQTVMVQRRTMYRMFLLLPTDACVEIVAYCLGYVSGKYGVQIHEFVFLSNHYHLVLTDPYCELPCFMRDLNSLIARAVNASRGQWESVWSAEPYCAPELISGDDIFDKCIYTLCNPNKAGLVRHIRDYGGLNSWSLAYGDKRVCRKPAVLFSDNLPETVTISLSRPTSTRPELTDHELRLLVRRTVVEKERAHAHALRKAGGTFLGMNRLLRQSTTDTPLSRASRRGIRPRVAGRSRWARVAKIRRNQEFQIAYRRARVAYSAGDRDVIFPHGTYKLRIEFGVACYAAAEAPP